MDNEEYENILKKYALAYKCMLSAVDEIKNIELRSVDNNKERDAIVSINQEQYDSTVKALNLIKEANNVVVKNLNYKNLINYKIIQFPIKEYALGLKRSIRIGYLGTSTFRIYLEKNVVELLIGLHKILHNLLIKNNIFSEMGIYKCKEDTKQKNYCQPNIPQHDNYNYSLKLQKLAELEEEYECLNNTLNMLKGILGNSKRDNNRLKQNKRVDSNTTTNKSEKVTNVSGARNTILQCLFEMSEVRKQIKHITDNKKI